MRTTTVVTAAVVPKMQQVKRSVHNVMYILSLHTRTAVVLVADAHNEVQGIHTVGIICTVIYRAYNTYCMNTLYFVMGIGY